jgi:hypothetical protein
MKSNMVILFLFAATCFGGLAFTEVKTTPSTTDFSTMTMSLYGKRLVYFARVNKGGDYHRRVYIDSASAQLAVQLGKIPANALLVQETWEDGVKTDVFIRVKKKDGQYTSGSFSPGAPDFSTSNDGGCNGCHTAANSTDVTFTAPLLPKALLRKSTQVVKCNAPTFNPCDLTVYKGD